MMNKRIWRGLLAVSTLVLLTGCSWFGGGGAPTGKARPGADRQIAPTGTLPSANPGGQSEQGVVPADETRNPIGSVVTTKGGQRSQKEAADKAAADRDAKEREQRNAADRETKAKQQPAPPATPPSE
ncbi:hypothetical protein SAMN02990966_03922 [Rhodospirillales bacterium URHD0017]|nr:hypothetical protein SAMN02990966_03922 [Rhodospirillales bacterium URHD0017]